MTTPDPKNPKVGDWFHSLGLDEVLKVVAVTRRHRILESLDGKREYAHGRAYFEEAFKPVPPPALSRPVHVWVCNHPNLIEVTSDLPAHCRAWGTYRKILLDPDGTWAEVKE